MKRLNLLGMMTALALLIVFSIWIGSPYEPVVQPVVDIEEIWKIEDARQESEEPLVDALSNNGIPLGYDRESNTFYCTLGLEQQDTWPDIHLRANTAEKTQLVFVDDYNYDWCREAISEGYAYQVMAYTDKEYWYFDIVFTGLPIISLYCTEEITEEDTPAHITVSAYGHEPVTSEANIHLRGGGTRFAKKKNLRVKFTRTAGGRSNTANIPGFGLRESIILNPMVMDDTLLRDRISWKLYEALLGEDGDSAFDERQTGYAEVYLNDEYQGVYLMLEPIDPQEELAKAGNGSLLTDSVYRSTLAAFVDERPVIQNPLKNSGRYEIRYEPTNSSEFGALEEYLNLLTERDDAAFVRLATCMNQESCVRYVLFRQVAGLTDNVSNNLYLWARMTPEGVRYELIPWDLDKSWGAKPDAIGDDYQNWLSLPVVDKMLMCDVPGLRELMIQRWREWRENVLSYDYLAQIIAQCSGELTDSGALLRNAERWEKEADIGMEELLSYTSTRLEVLDVAISMFENSDTAYPPFLTGTYSEEKNLPIL